MQKKPAGSSPPLNARKDIQHRRFWSRLRNRAAIAVVIFLLAFGVRLLTWHDTRLEVGRIQTSVVGDYQRVADLIRDGGISSFFSSSSALANPNNLGHPPGYSILLAGIYSIAGRSNAAVQMCQIATDAFCAVLIFLIIAELLPLSAGIIAGLLAALSPQLAWNSVLLLPDSISVVPVLLAVYVFARALRNPRLLSFIIVGILIGISCWLRANFMLLSFFVAAVVALQLTAKRWQFALAVICGTLLIVLPLTIRNAIVFHRFIPLSLGAGQTFLEGIADYDKDGRFDIPSTDMGIMKQEAEIYQRPDYYGTLFNPDGVERERARLSRGFAVVRSHPIWFAGVMAKRASSMVRLERARLISTEPPVSRSLDLAQLQPVWSKTGADLITSEFVKSPSAISSLGPDGQSLTLSCDDSKYDLQAMTSFVRVQRNLEYVFALPIKIEQGRVRVSVSDPLGKVYARDIVEPREDKPAQEQPTNLIKLPVVATTENIRLAISNEAPASPPIITIGAVKLYELGPARFLWTRYPRLVIHAVQRLFLTAFVLPLAIIGLVILIWRRNTRALVILSVVPIYFFLVQSLVHTEYRYVLAVVYFLFAFAAVALGCGVQLIIRKLGATLRRPASAAESVPSA
jgi:hypothetical protein